MPALQDELAAERAHLEASRTALRRMREHAEDLFSTGDQVAGDPFAAETLGRHLARRIAELAAPISRKFYQASVKDPQDVRARRRFGFAKGELTSFEDENLLAGEELRTSRVLLEEIERPRVGPMRDIVATIQPEQDELVRAELDESICVQGAPGTGNPNPGL
ncbi:hypothetical protein GCM10010399_43280 [Dactylosporangium fulvum]